MATRKRLNAPQGRIQTRLQANRALILSAPVLDQLEAQPQEPRWGPSLEVRSVPWWEGWPVRYSVAERVMLPAKPRIRLSRNSTGRTSTRLALITSQVELLTITSLPISTGGRTRRTQNSRRRASMKLSQSFISDGLASPARLRARPGSILKNQLETPGIGCAVTRTSPDNEKVGGSDVYCRGAMGIAAGAGVRRLVSRSLRWLHAHTRRRTFLRGDRPSGCFSNEYWQ